MCEGEKWEKAALVAVLVGMIVRLVGEHILHISSVSTAGEIVTIIFGLLAILPMILL